jgi:hypothetical protein
MDFYVLGERMDKIKISRAHFEALAKQEAELVDKIQAGVATDSARECLAIIQEILRKADLVEPTWTDGPTGGSAA